MSEPTPDATAEKAAPAGWKVKSKFLGIGLLIGVLGGLGAAGKVYMDLSGTIEALEEKAAVADDRDAALQARAAVAATETELEQSNYGNAAKHLEVAQRKLAGIDRATTHLNADILKTISERLSSVVVSANGANTNANNTLDDIGLALDRELLRSN